MGLLDQGAMMSPEMGMAMGLLSAGGPSRMPVSLGQGLAQGYQGYQQAQQLHAEQKMRDMQIQQQQEQIAMARQRQEEAKRRQEAMAKILSNPAIPQHIREGVAAGAIDIGDLYKPQKLGEGDSLVSPIQSMMGRDGVIAQGAPKQAKPPEGMRYDESGKLVVIPEYVGMKKEIAGAGRAQTNIFNNTKDNFKNERDLRNDFQGLPTTKAFREVQSAYDQIRVAIKAESPAGDLAAGTKIMKMLDPTSVVRESELGMAMAATGLMDRLSNYANLVATGQKLTPSQRKDFGDLAESLYAAAESRYNQFADEYRKTAGDYGLNPDQVAKPAKRSAISNSGWSATVVK